MQPIFNKHFLKMNKKLLVVSAVALIVSSASFAGGLLTNTNQNAAFLRNPARDAVIAIDGVYSNPAGIAFLPKGTHFSLSWQAAWQKREITSTFPYYANNESSLGTTTKKFVGKAQAPVIPSFQFAYVFNDKWSVSAQFAIGGGGGKCEFENGLGSFEQLVGSQIMGTGLAQSYGLTQNLTGEQYFYALQVGGTYKITDNVAVFGGVRGVLANCAYEGAIRNIKVNGMNAAQYQAAADMALAGANQALQAGLTDKYIELMTTSATAGAVAAQIKDDYVLDCQQDGFGITPIIGVDVNLGKLNLAAKYEFRTKIELENDSKNSDNVDQMFSDYKNGGKIRSDIPALLTVGAQYAFYDNFRVNGGYHLYFDKDASGSPTQVSNNTWEASLGCEGDITDRWTLSFGVQRTQYGFDDEDMSDMNFNIRNTSLGLGGAYKINKVLKLQFGYYHTFYDNHKVVKAENAKDLYTRKNDVVGLALDFRF